jgi:histidinol-phosphate aminotransferase
LTPKAVPGVQALSTSAPFVAPEALARRAGLATLLRLGANESPFGPSPRAIEAMRAEISGLWMYSEPEHTDLRAALARHHGCAPENVCVAAGIDDLLALAVRAYLGDGTVALTYGTYPTFMYHVLGHGGHAVTVPYADDGRIELDALAALARAQCTPMVYLANPDNPSGWYARPEQVAHFLGELPAETMVVLDEAYIDFIDHFTPAVTIDPRIIRVRTFSKIYGMAGARIAYALASPEAVANFQKIRQHFGVNRLAQIGAIAALDDREFLDRVRRETAQGREYYYALGRRLGCPALPSQTNFVCFDIGTRARAEAIVEELLLRSVFVRKPGLPPLDRCIRVTVAAPADQAHVAAVFAEALAAVDAKEDVLV